MQKDTNREKESLWNIYVKEHPYIAGFKSMPKVATAYGWSSNWCRRRRHHIYIPLKMMDVTSMLFLVDTVWDDKGGAGVIVYPREYIGKVDRFMHGHNRVRSNYSNRQDKLQEDIRDYIKGNRKDIVEGMDICISVSRKVRYNMDPAEVGG